MKISGIIPSYTLKGTFGADLHINGKRANAGDLKKLLRDSANDSFINSGNIQDKRVTYYSRGKKLASETEYDKNGKCYKTTWYDYDDGKVQWVCYTDKTLSLSRNGGKEWKKTPKIDFKKETDGKTLMLHTAVPDFRTNDGTGAYSLTVIDKNGERLVNSCVYLTSDGQYCHYFDNGLEDLQYELKNLKTLILSDEYRDSFGASRLFNENLDGAIKYLAELGEKA